MIPLRKVVAAMTAAAVLFSFASCAASDNEADSSSQDRVWQSEAPGYYRYLGDIDYSVSPAALVYEQIYGEEEGFLGIQYREVTDLGGLTVQEDIPLCLYFYTSLSNDSAYITAGVEDLAQTLQGKVLFVAIDAASDSDISAAYAITGYPDFVLINDGALLSTFESVSRGSWSLADVVTWLSDYGYEPDYSLL